MSKPLADETADRLRKRLASVERERDGYILDVAALRKQIVEHDALHNVQAHEQSKQRLRAEQAERRGVEQFVAAVAHVLDRAGGYTNDSCCRCALKVAAASLALGEHIEALEHGELADIEKWPIGKQARKRATEAWRKAGAK